MNKISNSNTLEMIIKILILLLVAKALSVTIWIFLPSEGITLEDAKSYRPQYQRIDFKNMVQNAQKKASKAATQNVKNGINITNMVLKGLYGSKEEGFIIIALKSSPNNTSIISVGALYSGYKLKAILQDGALFEKASKEYILRMDGEKNKVLEQRVQAPAFDDEPKTVTRGDISYYQKNPNQIWKDIAIDEIKNGSQIDGFKIKHVRKGSKMDKLGLKKGDIIIRANNKELKSYKDAFDIYNKIDKLHAIQIVILRNNEEKELTYEIN